MSDSAKSYYDNSALKRNLTWTLLTESNLGSTCTDPTTQHFMLYVTTCVNQTYYFAEVGKYGGRKTEYAESCKTTILNCGGGPGLKCYIDKHPCSNSYYKSYSRTICANSSCGENYVNTIKSIKTFYSYELRAMSDCSGAATSNITYYVVYYGSDSGSCSSGPDCCSNNMLSWAQRPRYIVKKNGK